VRDLLGAIDRFARKAMLIRLNPVSDAVPQKLRTLLSATLVDYERDPGLLRERVASMLDRLDPSRTAALTDAVCDAAARVLAARATLRQGVFELVRSTAAAWLPGARRAARDRTRAEDERDGWARARVDLEQLAARGETVLAGSFAERLARVVPPADDPEAEPEADPTAIRFSLLELD
jgi:hypothetical protein